MPDEDQLPQSEMGELSIESKSQMVPPPETHPELYDTADKERIRLRKLHKFCDRYGEGMVLNRLAVHFAELALKTDGQSIIQSNIILRDMVVLKGERNRFKRDVENKEDGVVELERTDS